MVMLIDDRENEWVKNHTWSMRTKVKRLEVGDLLIQGGIVVELKEINDFVKSLEQRMWQQLHDLEENLAQEDNGMTTGCVIVYGTVSDLNRFNMEPRKIKGIYGAMARIIVSYGIPIIWVRERSQLIKLVEKLHDKGGTNASKRRPDLTKRRYKDNRVNLLTGIEGIGHQTANDILKHDSLNTINDVASSTEGLLQEVDGVGPKTAETIYDAFHSAG